MATSRAPAVIDALFALAGASPGLAEARIHDGPQPTSDPLKQVVCIGWDGDEDSDEAADVSQEWAGLGAKARDETIQVPCAAIAWHGSTAMKPVRDLAFAMVAEFEAGLRADPSLGFPPPTVVALATGNAYQRQTQSGAQCRVVFTIAVRTRI